MINVQVPCTPVIRPNPRRCGNAHHGNLWRQNWWPREGDGSLVKGGIGREMGRGGEGENGDTEETE